MNKNDRFVIGSTLKLILEFLILILLHKSGVKLIEREDVEMAVGMTQGVTGNLGKWVYGEVENGS